MGGQRAFHREDFDSCFEVYVTPLMHGNPSRWNTACDEETVNIAGFWILERRALPPMASFLGTSVLALISPSEAGRSEARQHREEIVQPSARVATIMGRNGRVRGCATN